MSVRVTNHYLCSLLYVCERASSLPIFRQVNELARIGIVPIITRYVQFYLRKESGIPSLNVYTRHGVREKMGYKLFSSDIDYTAILPNSSHTKTYKATSEAYRKLRQKNLALGELQMLSEHEQVQLERLLSKYSSLIGLINDTRKIAHLEASHRSGPSLYHRTRARLSLNRVLARRFPATHSSYKKNPREIDWRQLSLDFSNELNKQIASLPNQEELQGILAEQTRKSNDKLKSLNFYSPYFSINISSADENKDGLALTPETLLILLSILPPGTAIPRIIWSSVKALRQSSPLGELYRALLTYEAINTLATFRPKTSFNRNEIRHLLNLKMSLKAYRVPFEPLSPWISKFSEHIAR